MVSSEQNLQGWLQRTSSEPSEWRKCSGDADVDPLDEDPLEMEQAIVQGTGSRPHLCPASHFCETGIWNLTQVHEINPRQDWESSRG